MTKEELQSTYSKLSTQELIEIIDRKFEYTELALTVAFEEIAKRNISEEEIAKYKTVQFENYVKFVKKNIVDDLSLLQKNFFFFIWIPIINFPFKRNFIDDGFILKMKQAQYYSLTGFSFFVIIAFISEIYTLTTLISVGILLLSFLIPYAFDEFFNRKRQIEHLRRMIKKENPQSEE